MLGSAHSANQLRTQESSTDLLHRFNPEVIIDGLPEPLLAPKVSFRRLHGRISKQKLDLLQLAAGSLAETGTGPPPMPSSA